ncbi:MAG: response regulator transcription factor [Nakamurella sp.]
MQTPGPARVVLVEDSDPIRTTVSRALVAEGFAVTALADGAELERELQERSADLVVLDVMLPGRDGFALLDLVRSRTAVPVLMLTARDATADRVRGLTNGADDYLVKPFAMAELIARCRVLLRRSGGPTAAVVLGDLELRDGATTVLRAGALLELTDTERRLLGYLAARPGRVVTKTQLLTAVWGYDGFDPNVVEVHISAVRRKLEQHGPRMLHTVRGTGYRLGDPT